MSSNVSQSYPYGSETEAERAARLEATYAAHEGLRDKVVAATTPLDGDARYWTWKCPAQGCPGILHAAGYARDLHAVFAVCDTCGRTYLR